MLSKNQKQQIKKALLQLDFSEKEIYIYLSALGVNNASILSISKDVNYSRGTVYDIVEKLKAKGFLAEIKKGKKRKIVAENPTAKFYSLLEDKHEKLQKEKKLIDNILPIIKVIDVHDDFKPQVRVYEGDQGFRQVWDDIFQCPKKNWLSIARIETFVKFSGEDFLREILERKKKLGFSSRAINEYSERAKKMRFEDRQYSRETRLTLKEFSFPSTEIIYGDKIAMFSTRGENIILIIESKDFTQTHRAYFEMMWKMLEK